MPLSTDLPWAKFLEREGGASVTFMTAFSGVLRIVGTQVDPFFVTQCDPDGGGDIHVRLLRCRLGLFLAKHGNDYMFRTSHYVERLFHLGVTHLVLFEIFFVRKMAYMQNGAIIFGKA